MDALEALLPRRTLRGVVAPVVTAFLPDGGLDSASQEKLLQFLNSDGSGVHAVCSLSEWSEAALLNKEQQFQLLDTCHYALRSLRFSQHWLCASASQPEQVLELLTRGAQLQMDAALIAPQSLSGTADPVVWLHEEVLSLYQTLDLHLPLLMQEENQGNRLRTRQIKQLARLFFVNGVIVNRGARSVGNYMKGARHHKGRDEFGVYLGSEIQLFKLFAPEGGIKNRIRSWWNRIFMGSGLPQGTMALSANLFPDNGSVSGKSVRSDMYV